MRIQGGHEFKPMNKVGLNEMAALMMVLDNISVKELLQQAMDGLSNTNNIKAQSNADICSQAISIFLKW